MRTKLKSLNEFFVDELQRLGSHIFLSRLPASHFPQINVTKWFLLRMNQSKATGKNL